MYAYPSSKTDHTSKKLPHPKAHLYTSNTSTPIQLQAVTQQMLTQEATYSMSTYPSVLPHLQKQIGNQAVAQMMLISTLRTDQSLQPAVIQRKLRIDGQKTTPADLMIAFGKVGIKEKITTARQQYGLDIALFTAILQQEIDEYDQAIYFIENKELAHEQLKQIASNILQKFSLHAVMDKEDGETTIFYDSVEQHVTKEEVKSRLKVLKFQWAIFPKSMQTTLLAYNQMSSLSRANEPMAIDMTPIDAMEQYLQQYLDQTKNQLDATDARIQADSMLVVVAPQLSEYLNGFKYLSKEHLLNCLLKNLNDNLLFLNRRLDGLYSERSETNTSPVVYLHPTAVGTPNDYISMVHKNWNAGRGNPKAATSAKHIHVNGYSENVIYTMQRGNQDLYIHGHVTWHLDKDMKGSEVTATQKIENYSQNLVPFSIYMKDYDNQWITELTWYQQAAHKYINIDHFL